MAESTCIVQHPDRGWLLLSQPRRVLIATTTETVTGVLHTAEAEALAGCHVAGFVTYEAAPAFDPAFTVHPPSPAGDSLPLAWFAVFERAERVDELPPAGGAFLIGDWTPSIPAAQYERDLARIRDWIAAGDTYQANFTFRMQAPFTGDAYALFHRLTRQQAATCQAWIDTGRFAICSASPELFFMRTGTTLTARPMKGTIRRAPDTERDRRLARRLARSPKDRAENVMITDMIRNDMGRVADPGSVRAGPLFTIERYPTLYQMTSSVTAQSDVSLPALFGALFPCASITGAPKIRTMQIIRALETQPRGLYTGAVGVILPGGDCRFNVAIRTAIIDRERETAEYGVGSGIVWDSDTANEYAECMLKAVVLTRDTPHFELLETLLWHNGWFLAERHLARLAASASYFGFRFAPDDFRALTDRLASGFADGTAHRVRITLGPDGHLAAAHQPFDTRLPESPLTVRWAAEPIDTDDPFLYHKTTRRDVYARARQSADGAHDVLLWNTRSEATESTIANLVVQRRDGLLTPPTRCGLLAGTLRADLLARGILRERVVTRRMVETADAVWLVNSVRGWQRVYLVDDR